MDDLTVDSLKTALKRFSKSGGRLGFIPNRVIIGIDWAKGKDSTVYWKFGKDETIEIFKDRPTSL